MNEQSEAYIASLLQPNADWVEKLEQIAAIDRVPIMEPIGMAFLMQIIRLYKPMNILEIGTAIGYSALRMNEANEEATITTIERDEERYNQAVEHIKQQNKQEKIKPIFADALDEMAKMVQENLRFDFIFIDAAKGQYLNFFHLADQLLTEGGVIVTDNVLFRGHVYNLETVPKRIAHMVKKLGNYNEMIARNENYDTMVAPVGDGVAISIKKKAMC